MVRDLPVASTLTALLLALATPLIPLRPATAQASDQQLDSILADIDKKTDQYSKFRSLLTDPDQAKHMAAFNAMTNSGILTLQEMALDYAFDSGDPAMRSAALQATLTKTKALTFNLEPSSEASERTRETMSRYGGGFAIKINSWDVATASFTKGGDTYSGFGSGRGQVSGSSLLYDANNCRVSVVLEETGRKMLGELARIGFSEPVKVSLSIR